MYHRFSQDKEYSTFSNGVGQNHRPRQQQTEARVKMVELQRGIARAALRADSCRVWPRWPSITSTPPELRHGSSVGARNSRIRPDLGSRARCVRTSRIGLFAVTMALACSSRVMGRDPGTVCCWWAESAARLLEQHCVLRSVDQVYLVVSKFICSGGTAAVQWLAAPTSASDAVSLPSTSGCLHTWPVHAVQVRTHSGVTNPADLSKDMVL
jgi:hypothetical protein